MIKLHFEFNQFEFSKQFFLQKIDGGTEKNRDLFCHDHTTLSLLFILCLDHVIYPPQTAAGEIRQKVQMPFCRHRLR